MCKYGSKSNGTLCNIKDIARVEFILSLKSELFSDGPTRKV